MSEQNLSSYEAIIRVAGIGGGGANALQRMTELEIAGVYEYICINTDLRALENIEGRTPIQIGQNITKGLGAGAKPEIGRQAAEESIQEISAAIKGTDLLFIAAGMGGGTGSGAAPIVAKSAKEQDILTVSIVTVPFQFEGKKRTSHAQENIEELRNHTDCIIIIENDKLVPVLGKQTRLLSAFGIVNDILYDAVKGISELVSRPGYINLDFADVKTAISEMGLAVFGCGIAKGDDRIIDAFEKAISSPLLGDYSIGKAKSVLVNIVAGRELSIGEFSQIGEAINGVSNENATILVGTTITNSKNDELQVTVLATGLEDLEKKTKRLRLI